MIVGIDTGVRRLAFCALQENEPPIFGWYETPSDERDMELKDLRYWVHSQVAVRLPGRHHVYLETLANGRGPNSNPQSLMQQSFTVGMVLATVGGTLISPSTWKASILGHGHADKDDIRAWVEHTSPAVAAAIQAASPTRADRREDLYDAYCIALHGDLARRHPDRVDEPKRMSPRARRSRQG